MPLRLCPEDPVLELLRKRFDGLNLLGTPSPGLRPLCVIALPRRGAPLELGWLGDLLSTPGFTSPPLLEEPLPELHASQAWTLNAELAGRLLPAVLGAFGVDGGALAHIHRAQGAELRLGGVRALALDRGAMGRALGGQRLDPRHPHTGYLLQPGVRFVVVDRVILAEQIEVRLSQQRQSQLQSQAGGAALAGEAAGGLAEAQGQVLQARAKSPVVLAWTGLAYAVDEAGRLGQLQGEVRQMGAASEGGERVQAWPADSAGRLRRPGEAQARAQGNPPLVPRGIVAASLARTGPLRPPEPRLDTRGQYTPTYDAGSADVWEDAERVGVSFTATPSGGTVTEDQLLLRKSSGGSYPVAAPLTETGTRSGAGIDEGLTAFDDREDFLETAWDTLDPPSGSTVYHVRGCARRYTVESPSQLAEALGGAQGSEWVDLLVERDLSDDLVQTGYLYVEVFSPVNGVLRRRIHQFTPPGMALPPATNRLNLEPGTGMSLPDLVNEHVSEDWAYVCAEVEASVVTSGPLTASTPSPPPLLDSGDGVNS